MPKMVKRINFLFVFTSCLLVLLHVAQCAKPTTTTTPASTKNVTTTTSKPVAAAAKSAKKGAAKATTTTSTTTTTTITPLEEDEAEQEPETLTSEGEEEPEETTTVASKKKTQKKDDAKPQKSSNRTAIATPPPLPLDMYSEFYHFDVEKTKQLPAADDTSAKLSDVYVPVTLYDKPYQDIFVSMGLTEWPLSGFVCYVACCENATFAGIACA